MRVVFLSQHAVLTDESAGYWSRAADGADVSEHPELRDGCSMERARVSFVCVVQLRGTTYMHDRKKSPAARHCFRLVRSIMRGIGIVVAMVIIVASSSSSSRLRHPLIITIIVFVIVIVSSSS